MKVSRLTDSAVRELLEKIMNKLDELDEDDFFGTEGWKHTFEIED